MTLRIALLASIVVAPVALSRPAAAQDAPFGCKVLLCAAAASPSWAAIPYCVPVMQQLFTQLARGQAWPSCSEANASPIGFQPFNDCPAGEIPIAEGQMGESARGGALETTYSASPNGGFCGAPIKMLTSASHNCSGAYLGGAETILNARAVTTVDTGGQCYQLSARPRNPTPYYVDITTANGVTRFAFSLAGYGG